MNALVRKEIRLILPAWIITMLVAVVPWWTLPRDLLSTALVGQPLWFLFVFCALYLSISSFGQEFSLNTFPLLLAQPVPRRRIWTLKLVVLGAAFATVLLGLFGAWNLRASEGLSLGTVPQAMLTIVALVFILAAGGLWTTLLTRQIGLAFWLTLLTPIALAFLGTAVVNLLNLPAVPPFDDGRFILTTWVVMYCLPGFLWARRLFRRAEDVPWSGGAITIPIWRRSRVAAQTSTSAAKKNSLSALIRKEFHFQQLSLIICALLVPLQITLIVLRITRPGSIESNYLIALIVCWFLLWLMQPFLIGGMAVAEERKLGTLESFLCLPTTRRTQFAVKLGVAIFLSLLVSVVIPWTLESIGIHLGMGNGFFKEPFDLGTLLTTAVLFIGLTFISFFSSTLSRNTLQAIGVTFVLSLPVMGLGIWVFTSAVGMKNFEQFIFPTGSPLGAYIGYPVMFLAVLILAFKNFRHLHVGPSLWIRNALALLISFGAVWIVTGLVYNRVWENFMTLEPRHGHAQLSGSVRAKITFLGQRVFVLLPDGRLWTGRNYEKIDSGERTEIQDYVAYIKDGKAKEEKILISVPTDGMFIGSNWINVAGSGEHVYGIQSDGSLWRIISQTKTKPVVPALKRVGTDSSWKTIAAGRHHFFALKSDGTLWGWDDNWDFQIGDAFRQNRTISEPIYIGTNWVNVFARYNYFVGIKSDGSVLSWLDDPATDQPTPERRADVRLMEGATNWTAWTLSGTTTIVIQNDGSLWAGGIFYGNVFGYPFKNSMQNGEPLFSKLLRVGNGSDWLDVCGNYDSILGLKKDGTLVRNNRRLVISPWRSVRELSRYSDWIAIKSDWVGDASLAADGTLTYWREANGNNRLLAPSRRPMWTANIFSITKDPAAEVAVAASSER
jgi:hypothetical protein